MRRRRMRAGAVAAASVEGRAAVVRAKDATGTRQDRCATRTPQRALATLRHGQVTSLQRRTVVTR
jgi:hypothetical protein